MIQYLPLGQIIIGVILIVLILLQEQSSGLSGVFGGDSSGAYQTRRGLEKWIFYGTIILAALFLLLSVLDLIY